MKPIEPSFLNLYDSLILDLDGTLINGSQPIEHAVKAIEIAKRHQLKISYATNNASRTAQMVVDHLAQMGFEARSDEVINSPMVAIALLAKHVAKGAKVLVVGGAGISEELNKHGYQAVYEDSADVEAVVQGYAASVGWKELAEAAYAVNRGALYIATNTDSTLPTERGFAPGNGALVQAVVHATNKTPLSAGKPQPDMFLVALEKMNAKRALAVGDRLDTDLTAGNLAGVDTLQVLTGVSSWLEAANAPAISRPKYIRPDLSFLDRSLAMPVISNYSARLGAVTAELKNLDSQPYIHLSGDVRSWRTPQVVISLINHFYPDSQFEGSIKADSDLPFLKA